jgi:tetraacyldisaccharide 4'-kinase
VISPQQFRELVGGRRRGLSASLLRGALRAAEMPYSAAMRYRNWRYDRGRVAIHRVEVPVISVGNLTLGGTGKTPVVAWLARWLRERQVRVTIVSRGYGAEAGARNDEALELEQQLPDVPHVQNSDRVAAARLAIEEFECQAILLDDGFQHRRLARDLDLVLLDALEPFGFEHVFPRGTLREPLAGLHRANVVLLSRADMLSEGDRLRIRERVAHLAPKAVWGEVRHAPRALLSASGKEMPLASSMRSIAAFCGIGNPAGFRHTLESLQYGIAGFHEFPDHHNYTRQDLEAIARWALELNADALLCTGKDLVKIGVDTLGSTPLWAVTIGIEFLSGREELEKRLLGSVIDSS